MLSKFLLTLTIFLSFISLSSTSCHIESSNISLFFLAFSLFCLCLSSSLCLSLIALTIYSTHNNPIRKAPNFLSTHIRIPYFYSIFPYFHFFTYLPSISIFSLFFSLFFSKQILLLIFNFSPNVPNSFFPKSNHIPMLFQSCSFSKHSFFINPRYHSLYSPFRS